MTPPPPKRPRFQFHHSTAVVVMFVAAIALGVTISAIKHAENSGFLAMLDYLEQNPTTPYPGDASLLRYELLRLLTELTERFPNRLSSIQPDPRQPQGIWVGCREIEETSGGLKKWREVCILWWENGQPSRLCRVPELCPAFAIEDALYLYWDHRRELLPEPRYTPWLEWKKSLRMTKGYNEEGWAESSDFRMVILDKKIFDQQWHVTGSVESFLPVVDGTRTKDGLSNDGVVLWDLDRLKQGINSYQSILDWR